MGDETLDRIVRIVAGHLGVPASAVTPAASFIDDLDADSLDMIELIMAFEEEFQTEIPEGAVEYISTSRTRLISRVRPGDRDCRYGSCR